VFMHWDLCIWYQVFNVSFNNLYSLILSIFQVQSRLV
jgi:hypothetical protein